MPIGSADQKVISELRGGPGWLAGRMCRNPAARSVFPFSNRNAEGIVRAMTRMLDIPAAPTAPFGARLTVNLRGLLLLTLR
jgi:hypothetical protein